MTRSASLEGMDVRRHTAGRLSTRFLVLLCATLVVAPSLLGGCGQASPPAAVTTPASTTATTASETGSSIGTDLEAVFARLAAEVDPLAVFAPTYVPAGATMPDAWWPVVELADPGAYEGPRVANPRVVGSGVDSEVQVVLRVGEGWLAILENFRGDLGDVTGTPVGTVAGNPAVLHVIDGGDLVQWSQDGRWYGVFGRGLPQEEVTQTAVGMQPVSPATP
jgi:hypothetical protein